MGNPCVAVCYSDVEGRDILIHIHTTSAPVYTYFMVDRLGRDDVANRTICDLQEYQLIDMFQHVQELDLQVAPTRSTRVPIHMYD